MPLTALTCYCSECGGDRTIPVDDALRHASERRKNQFPYELLQAMLAQVQDRGYRISTTTLTTKCLRSEVLQRTEEYAGDPKRMYPSFRGTMFHGQLELHAHPYSKEEPRYHILLPGDRAFSGAPDLVDVKAGTLYDYKFSKENPRFDYPWPGHKEQGQINRWLVDHADYVEWRGEYFPLTDAGATHFIETAAAAGETPQSSEWDISLNRERFVPVDWQGIYVVYMDDKGPKPLLITKSEQVPTKDGKGTKPARVADIWPDEDVERLILRKYEEAEVAFQNAAAGQYPDIPEEFTAWKHPLCEWCPVKDSCIEHYIEDEVGRRSQEVA